MMVAERQRLKWQCRRGMLELDLLLQAFLDNGYDTLGAYEKTVFTRLLDLPDQELVEMLMGRSTHKDMHINGIIDKIRQVHCHQS